MTVNKIKAAACDLDGTLLDGSVLSRENLAAVKKMQDVGIIVTLSTGRVFHQTIDTHRKLGLSTALVTSDGALASVPGAAILQEQPLPLEVSARVIELASKSGVTCVNYFRHGVHVSSKFDWSVGMERHKEVGPAYFRYTTAKAMARRKVYKTLLFSLTPEKLDAMEQTILNEFSGIADSIRNGPLTLEFVARGVSKVAGLAALAKHYGLLPADFVAFGDGVNDVGMFGWAGLSVCMHHGHDAAKAAAKLVAPKTAPDVNFAAAVELALGSGSLLVPA